MIAAPHTDEWMTLEYYCPACGEWTFIAMDSVQISPGHLAFICEHCKTPWMVRLEFHEIVDGES